MPQPSAPHDVVDLIRTKRDGARLTDAQIQWLIAAYTAGEVAEEQMSAMAMAVLLRGLDRVETSIWTQAMIDTGVRMDFQDLTTGTGTRQPTADKHSTGGVGDKITLPLAPLVASFGVAVPQLSGRGLGHTGGTLDKLEAIPGWRADLSTGQILTQLREVGAVVCAAGADLAPADKKLYALRDVTGTVESIPLIASSIMSKKIAEGADSLVLDVKVGSGAFMKTTQEAEELARTMVALGVDASMDTTALITSMNSPLGFTAGNAVEVTEALEVLAGGGPRDVVELTCALAGEMLAAAGISAEAAEHLRNGQAMDTWVAMIRAQGGDPKAELPQARYEHTITADHTGTLTRLDAYQVGLAAWRLGAGRARKEDAVSAAAGVRWYAKPGDTVTAGAPLFSLLTDEEHRLARAQDALATAVTIETEPTDVRPEPLIRSRIIAEDI